MNNVDNYLRQAYDEAKKAYKKLEVPVGAVIVKDGKIISKAYNLRETKKNSLAHAEILCINKACKKLKNWRLEDCTMYVTLYPCEMCMGAIKQARIKKVYFGAYDDKINDYDSQLCEYIENKECADILKEFFRKLRKK